MEENFDLFSFVLSADEMKRIEAFATKESLFFSLQDRALYKE